MRGALLLGAVLVLACPTVYAQTGATPGGAPLTLETLERMALDANPTLRQTSAAVEAARARARQAGAWPNPVAGYTAEEISGGPVIRGGEHGVFASQTIPLGGKLRRNQDVFERSADEAQSRADLQRQRVIATARTLYYEALVADRRVDSAERLASLANETVDISRQLFNTGVADLPDVLQSEIEARRASLSLEAARNERFTVWRRIGALVNAPALAPSPLAGSIAAVVPELDRAAVVKQALDGNAGIHAARAALERTRASTARAQRETSPDLYVRGAALYNRELLEAGGQPVGWEAAIEAGVSLPIFNRNQGGIAAARAEEVEAAAALRQLELRVEAQVAGEFGTYLTAVRAAEEFEREILPRATRAHALYLDRYRNAAAAYTQVLGAQRTLFQLNAAHLEYLGEAWRAALRLQGLVPGDVLGDEP